MSDPPMIVLLVISALGIGFALTMFILLLRERRKMVQRQRKFEQDMAAIQRERELIPTYTTDEERTTAIRRIMNWDK